PQVQVHLERHLAIPQKTTVVTRRTASCRNSIFTSLYRAEREFRPASASLVVGLLVPTPFRKKVSSDAQDRCVLGGTSGDAACRHRWDGGAALGDDLAVAAECRLRRQRRTVGQGLQQQDWRDGGRAGGPVRCDQL